MRAADTLRSLFEGDPLARIVPPGPISESEFPRPRPQEAIDAELIEDSDLRIKDVPTADQPGFTHFLDGAQKVWKVLYYGFDPVVIAHTSAAIVPRSDRQMLKVDDECYSGSLDAIGSPSEKLKDQFATLCRSYIPVELPEQWSPTAVGERIREQVGSIRKTHELAVASRFESGFLLIDGSIGEADALLTGREHAGIVKSHERLYVKTMERQMALFQMRRGQRSTVFLRKGSARQGADAYSFYLRLREEPRTEPLFGIVRIELPANPAWLARADEVAGWALAETRPLSLPDPRYHVLPYPIHLLEQHLKARQPSDAAIRGILGI